MPSSPPSSRPSLSSQAPPFSSDTLSPGVGPSVSSTFLRDPRSSSQASLHPTASATRHGGRRTLLLVYIHGFMGNETSFQSFPAHLHNLLTVTLGDGEDAYLVHTKVYPKFKTRHAIKVATLEFSKWLSEFESETTDIVLLGHSMGGILGAELTLLPSFYSPGIRLHTGILGMIAFDTPFLGMHPGIISSGLASLFRPAPPPALSPEQQTPEEELDPFFAQRPQRNFTVVPSPKPPSTWVSTLQFISKHHEHLTQATGKYLMSHLEFGACLADPMGLKTRYSQIRSLEDGQQTEDGKIDRVRFANYYTISYGREKGVVVPPPVPADMADEIVGGSGGSYAIGSALEAAHTRTPSGSSTHSKTPQSGMSTPAMQLQDLEPEPMSRGSSASEHPPSGHLPPDHPPPPPPLATQMLLPEPELSQPAVEIVPPTPVSPITSLGDVEALFPPISAPPTAPTLQAILESTEKHLRKALEKENKRQAVEYERQMKEYGKLVKAREKAIEKVYHDREKERKKKEKEKEKEREKEKGRADEEERDRQKHKLAEPQKALQEEEMKRLNQEKTDEMLERQKQRQEQKEKEKEQQKLEKEKAKKEKPPRKRKFCIIPSQPDEAWTPVEMKGVDEVGAHCGLFFVGEVYAKLVGDVADRIEGWVNDERTRRLVEQSGDDYNSWENRRPSTEKRAY
ncbi:hypothetical protein BZA05DRAFT_336000 [Tricharina praecox]|uniref:uncharacterized protein n=1 Tax=Tricharina praecox TaxID=43433 RepID=UPI0022210A43|nr:uncharacterized protein BZA05DRAFT_336000 [Tricharina praecox]KAI5853783.1 hypothetical protein BZA05DRAFT_336000 [Tricharina praecox]